MNPVDIDGDGKTSAWEVLALAVLGTGVFFGAGAVFTWLLGG